MFKLQKPVRKSAKKPTDFKEILSLSVDDVKLNLTRSETTIKYNTS